MSVLKPVNKQPRLPGAPAQSTLKRTESVDLSTRAGSEESAHPTSSSPATSETATGKKMENHPKGHKVRELSEVWETMDKQGYLRLTDTLTLGDVWVQPKSVNEDGVTFLQIVFGPNIKYREAVSKMSPDDLLQMLYLNDSICAEMEGHVKLGFDEWISEKTAAMIRAHGVDDATKRMKLANFVLTEDETFSFFPAACSNTVCMFFRKICCHSYKDKSENPKMKNPMMVKCPTRGKFEFMIEAKLMLCPPEWRTEPMQEEK